MPQETDKSLSRRSRRSNDSLGKIWTRFQRVTRQPENATPRTLVENFLNADESIFPASEYKSTKSRSSPTRHAQSPKQRSIHKSGDPPKADTNEVEESSFVLPRYPAGRRNLKKQPRAPTQSDILAFEAGIATNLANKDFLADYTPELEGSNKEQSVNQNNASSAKSVDGALKSSGESSFRLQRYPPGRRVLKKRPRTPTSADVLAFEAGIEDNLAAKDFLSHSTSESDVSHQKRKSANSGKDDADESSFVLQRYPAGRRILKKKIRHPDQADILAFEAGIEANLKAKDYLTSDTESENSIQSADNSIQSAKPLLSSTLIKPRLSGLFLKDMTFAVDSLPESSADEADFSKEPNSSPRQVSPSKTSKPSKSINASVPSDEPRSSSKVMPSKVTKDSQRLYKGTIPDFLTPSTDNLIVNTHGHDTRKSPKSPTRKSPRHPSSAIPDGPKSPTDSRRSGHSILSVPGYRPINSPVASKTPTRKSPRLLPEAAKSTDSRENLGLPVSGHEYAPETRLERFSRHSVSAVEEVPASTDKSQRQIPAPVSNTSPRRSPGQSTLKRPSRRRSAHSLFINKSRSSINSRDEVSAYLDESLSVSKLSLAENSPQESSDLSENEKSPDAPASGSVRISRSSKVVEKETSTHGERSWQNNSRHSSLVVPDVLSSADKFRHKNPTSTKTSTRGSPGSSSSVALEMPSRRSSGRSFTANKSRSSINSRDEVSAYLDESISVSKLSSAENSPQKLFLDLSESEQSPDAPASGSVRMSRSPKVVESEISAQGERSRQNNSRHTKLVVPDVPSSSDKSRQKIPTSTKTSTRGSPRSSASVSLEMPSRSSGRSFTTNKSRSAVNSKAYESLSAAGSSHRQSFSDLPDVHKSPERISQHSISVQNRSTRKSRSPKSVAKEALTPGEQSRRSEMEQSEIPVNQSGTVPKRSGKSAGGRFTQSYIVHSPSGSGRLGLTTTKPSPNEGNDTSGSDSSDTDDGQAAVKSRSRKRTASGMEPDEDLLPKGKKKSGLPAKSPKKRNKPAVAGGKSLADGDFFPLSYTKTHCEHFLRKRVSKGVAVEAHKQVNKYFKFIFKELDGMLERKPRREKYIRQSELVNMFLEKGLWESKAHFERDARTWLSWDDQDLVVPIERATMFVKHP